MQGYHNLREKSVDIAKNAEIIARHAEKLADEGHFYRYVSVCALM
jgi:hypothetical protein